MGLSSNILWHQTNYRNLRKILKDKRILCSYGMEDLSFVSGQKLAFPMVSMCDLPFSELLSYQGKYGDYSIGLSRDWGIKNKFNPVWYCDPQSAVTEALREIFDGLMKNCPQGILFLMHILSYVKPVEGELIRHDYKSYRFYDEREVRFVPSMIEMLKRSVTPILYGEEYDQYKEDHGGVSTLVYGVDFEWENVKYIIVKEDKQIDSFRRLLNRLGCPSEAIHVFSATQVKYDFIGGDHNIQVPKYELKENDIRNLIQYALSEYKKKLESAPE